MRRRVIDGYLDMGKPRIPPLPQNIVMTDRVTGTRYLLSHVGTPGALTPVLTSTLPRQPDTVFYGPLDGPYTSGFKLYIGSGALQTEAQVYAVANQRVCTRNGFQRYGLTITVDTAGNLVYTEFDL